MGKLHKKIIDFYNSAYFPFFCLFCIFLLQSCSIHVGWGDDAWFADVVRSIDFKSLVSFLIDRYQKWTSRTFIEFLLLFFVHHRNLWRIFNVFVNVIGAVSISYLTGYIKSRKLNLLVCMFFFLIPQYIYCHTGWIATTLNYSWPLYIGLFSLCLVKKISSEGKLRWYEYPLLILSSAFASNHEQMCITLFLLYSSFSVYYIYKNKKIKISLLMPLVVNISSLVYELTCPGNKVRYSVSIAYSFVDFDSISLCRKLELGFSSTLHEITIKANLISFVFALLIFLCVISKNKKSVNRFISGIPLIAFITFNFLVNLFPREFEEFEILKNSMTKYGSGITLNNPRSMLLNVFFVTLIFAVVYSTFLCFENRFRFFISLGILLIGFISRMVMSFSPCIWVSGERTFLFFYIAIIIVAILLYREINSEEIKKLVFFGLLIISFDMFFSAMFVGKY